MTRNTSYTKQAYELSKEQLSVLSDETRHSLIKKLSEHGGHIEPNLGMVEVTVAMHYLKKNHKLVITIEDGKLEGGYGQRVASFYGDSDMRVKNFGISKKFHTDFKPDELLKKHGMSVEKLVAYMHNA